MFKERVITALILAPLMLGGIFFLPLQAFSIFVGVIAVVGAWEWANIAGYTRQSARIAYAAFVALALYATNHVLQQAPEYRIALLALGAIWWLLAVVMVICYPNAKNWWQARWVRALLGLLVLVPMWVGFVCLKDQAHSSVLIAYLMLLVWGADTGAYFAGRRWGKAKLAPKVSPGKSWAGFWGGLATSLLVAVVFALSVQHWLMPIDARFVAVVLLMAVLTVLASVFGDLLESMMKRNCGIKDSSNLLPGHGGVLDRIDSMAAAVPVFAFMMLSFGWSLTV